MNVWKLVTYLHPYIVVVVINPLLLLLCQQAAGQQILRYGDMGEAIESQKLASSKLPYHT